MVSYTPDYDGVAWLPFGYEVGWCSVDVFAVGSWASESLDQRSVLGQSEGCTKWQDALMLLTFGLEGCSDEIMISMSIESEVLCIRSEVVEMKYIHLP